MYWQYIETDCHLRCELHTGTEYSGALTFDNRYKQMHNKAGYYLILRVNAALRADYFRTEKVLNISIGVQNRSDFCVN